MIESTVAPNGARTELPAVDAAREAHAARALLPHVRRGTRVLEIGCGAGWSSLLLAARAGDVCAWDPDPRARAAAREHVRRAGFDGRVRVVDALPDRGSFDLVSLSYRAPTDLLPLANDLGARLAVGVAPGARSQVIAAMHQQGLVPVRSDDGAPVVDADDLPESADDCTLLGSRVRERVGFDVVVHTDQASLLGAFDLDRPGVLLEGDLDTVDNDCERHARKRRDAEVLCGLAASHPGPCLDLGTSHGRSAFKLATNIGPHVVTTVNMLPEQAVAAGVHITHVLSRDEIGSYPRDRDVANIEQLYANTLDWDWRGVPNGLHLAFVDACHDEAAVLADSLQCWRRLSPGGFLVWHDFSPALASVHPWIASSMAGVRAFAERVGARGAIHHLLGSWCGVLRKEPCDA